MADVSLCAHHLRFQKRGDPPAYTLLCELCVPRGSGCQRLPLQTDVGAGHPEQKQPWNQQRIAFSFPGAQGLWDRILKNVPIAPTPRGCPQFWWICKESVSMQSRAGLPFTGHISSTERLPGVTFPAPDGPHLDRRINNQVVFPPYTFLPWRWWPVAHNCGLGKHPASSPRHSAKAVKRANPQQPPRKGEKHTHPTGEEGRLII